MPEGTGTTLEVRNMLALALDVDDAVVAQRWAEHMRPWFGVVKVGLELFSAEGPSVITDLAGAGFKVFVDLKLADIPNTTRKAARVLGSMGASYLTIHTSAGQASLEAGVEGLLAGAQSAGLAEPVALGVTVLTSEPEAPPELLAQRVSAAQASGCGGVVCAASDLATVKDVAPKLLAVVPGIRPAGSGHDDHGRAATPAQAVKAGAGLLVIGRAITSAGHPEQVAAAIAEEVAGAR